MKILQISPYIPFPPDLGGKISIYGILKYLSKRGNTMHFATYLKNDSASWGKEQLKPFSTSHILDVQTRNNPIDAALNLFSGIPYNISKYKNKALVDFIKEFFSKNTIDIVHIDHLHMGWIIDVIREVSDVPVVLREHNLEMMIMKRFSEIESNLLLKLYATIQYKKFEKYEPSLAKKFDLCIMISPKDEEILNALEPRAKTITIPVGVEKYQTELVKKDYEPYSIFHVGPLDWLPNLDGLKWYLNEIFPELLSKMPRLKLYIYGKDSDKLKIDKSISGNVLVKGYVKNLWAETLDKKLLIIPLRIGGGIRIKIIEMLAMGQNIISTSVGKEGIDITDGENILVADTAGEFIQKTIAYFNNQYDSAKMSFSGKELIKQKYTWEKIAEDFENTYIDLINRK